MKGISILECNNCKLENNTLFRLLANRDKKISNIVFTSSKKIMKI